MVSQLKHYMLQTGMNQTQVAQALGVSSATISQYLKGVYKGKNDDIDSAVNRLIGRHKDKVVEQKFNAEFVSTLIARRCLDVIHFAHVEGDINVITGAAGLGKTQALKQYVKQNPDVILVEVEPSCSPKVLLKTLCGELGLNETGLNHELFIALFGRMVAQAADLNVEAAVSFSHAISTHKVTSEIDFFTALDDRSNEDETGSAHMGALEFNSATYYRYISVDLGQLHQTLQGQDLKKAVDAFIKALYVAMPAARQSTQSGASGWEYAKILVRNGQRLQVPFERAVKAERQEGYLKPSIQTLKDYLQHKEKLSGSLFGKIAEYDFGEDENFNIDQLISALHSHIEVADE
ncbi:hypothetical protein A1D23_02165 [Chelonobacter oris]|uniref:type I-E CRISPR-associated protein Cas7/Cse4/CasC n=1 Tax=Chelonobacter oris TaxID=505317 RepID=UPI0024496264|nr:type I-E CRISPR-associated protein Cas7/Cse4/CasC [Chelonobacter oris]MDH3001207.1 hypothetical protein [Chelonobacter oris]